MPDNSDNIQVRLRCKAFSQRDDSDSGIIVFDTETSGIYVGGTPFGTSIIRTWRETDIVDTVASDGGEEEES